jgi:FtsZ-interacting cell division protein ZipA
MEEKALLRLTKQRRFLDEIQPVQQAGIEFSLISVLAPGTLAAQLKDWSTRKMGLFLAALLTASG